ncbi:hypothetical protein HAX54_028310, partial [Datura stramonium]|nr:hypothetical protein [Datura stramonium]
MAAIISGRIFSELPDNIYQKILSSHSEIESNNFSCFQKWLQMIATLDDREFVQTHSAKIYCGYHSKNLNFPSCRCNYRVDPVIKLAADNMTFKELY